MPKVFRSFTTAWVTTGVLLNFIEAGELVAYGFMHFETVQETVVTNFGTSRDTYDIAIIGGGVNGCGIARDAAGRGLSVLLLEKDDLASGTSSASSKMIHGGLRYLEQYEFSLVRKALNEREKLLAIAPHIVWPIRLVLPHNCELRPKWMIRLGLFLYDTLGGRKLLQKSRQIDLRSDVAGAALKPSYTSGFEYSDCWVDDARLVVLNALDAQRHGAKILTRCELQQAHHEDNHWQLQTREMPPNKQSGKSGKFKARILINAAGPWVSEVVSNRIMLDTTSDVRLVKGSHIVVPKLYEHDKAYIFQNADNRVIFALPFLGAFTLIGTTDVDVSGDPGGVEASDDEIRYLCNAANEYFTNETEPSDVVWHYAGVRPLFDDGESSASETTRDYVLELLEDENNPPVLSVFGGKITTYRQLAETALEKLAPWLPNLADSWTDVAPLPGGEFPREELMSRVDRLTARFPFIPPQTALRYFRAYGTECMKFLTGCNSESDMGIRFGADLYQREVEYLLANEWAITAQDIVWRRSKVGLFMTGDEIDSLQSWLNLAYDKPDTPAKAK